MGPGLRRGDETFKLHGAGAIVAYNSLKIDAQSFYVGLDSVVKHNKLWASSKFATRALSTQPTLAPA